MSLPACMVPSHIKNIIFDLGGVVIDINPAASFSALQAMVAESQSAQDLLSEQASLFLKYEKGLISDEQFRAGIRQLTRQSDTLATTIDDIWCQMLLEVPLPRLQLLKQLQGQYRTFVLSNTNGIHVAAFNKLIEAVSGQPSINFFFEKVYYSHELKMRKPDAEIYEYVLSDSNLIPRETLFLDDRNENLAAAETLGMATCLVTPERSIIDIFS